MQLIKKFFIAAIFTACFQLSKFTFTNENETRFNIQTIKIADSSISNLIALSTKLIVATAGTDVIIVNLADLKKILRIANKNKDNIVSACPINERCFVTASGNNISFFNLDQKDPITLNFKNHSIKHMCVSGNNLIINTGKNEFGIIDFKANKTDYISIPNLDNCSVASMIGLAEDKFAVSFSNQKIYMVGINTGQTKELQISHGNTISGMTFLDNQNLVCFDNKTKILGVLNTEELKGSAFKIDKFKASKLYTLSKDSILILSQDNKIHFMKGVRSKKIEYGTFAVDLNPINCLCLTDNNIVVGLKDGHISILKRTFF